MEQVRPSKAWYVVAGAAAVIATGIAIAVLVGGIVDTVSSYESIPRGEPTTVDLEAGGYTIYWEQRLNRPGVPEAIQVTGPTGQRIPLARYEGSETFSNSDYEAVAVYTFDAPTSGGYTFLSPLADIGVSKGIFGGIGESVLLAAAIGFAGLLVAIGIALFVFLRRRSARLAMEPGHGSPGAPATWSSPGGYGTSAPYGSAPSSSPSPAGGGFTPEWGPAPEPATPAPSQPSALPPAGWYADPEADGLRYWDGQAWTDHRAVRG